MREMHIWEFPKHFRVFCTPRFLDNSRRLHSHGARISRGYLLGNLFMPVNVFKQLAKRLVSTGRYTSLREAEREILAYKARSTSKPIWKPVLPLRDTPVLAELYAHLVADGGISKCSIPHYVNSSPVLVQRFSSLLRDGLGQVHQVIYQNKRGTYDLRFSNTAWEALKWIYGPDVGSKTAKLPNRFLRPRLREAVLRAFIDDEGGVDFNRRVYIGLANLKLLRQLHRISTVTIGAAHLTPIKKKPREEQFYFYIRSGGLSKIASLGLCDTDKKHAIDFLLDSKRPPGVHRRPGEARKSLIIFLRRSGGAKTQELSKRLKIQPSNTLVMLNKLLKANLVKYRREGNDLYWYLSKEKGI